MREEGGDIGFKMWVKKTVIVALVLLAVIVLVEQYIGVPLLTDTLIAISLTLCVGFTHEGLHYQQAMKLGYEPKWYRTTFKMGFEISKNTNTKQWRKDKRKIALAPYKVLVPLSIAFLGVGYIFNSFGIIIAGVASLLMHGISYPSEGRDKA